MTGQVSDLMFQIIARDQTRAAFDSAGKNAVDLAGKVDAGSRRMQGAIKPAGHEVAILAAQFSDIGVQLAGGQSPFLVALQQGSQIAPMLGQRGAAGAAALLGEAVVGLVNPFNLLTLAAIAGGGALLQYFFSLATSGTEAEETLSQQRNLIKQVADQWGDAVPQLKAYVDELDRAQNVADLQTVGNRKIADDLQSINEAFDAFIGKNQEVVDAINLAYDATGQSDTALSKFASTWEALVAKINDGTASQDDFRQATDLLKSAVVEGGGDLDAFGADFETLSGRIMTSLRALQQFQAQMQAALVTGIKAQAQIQDLTTGQINNPDLPDNRFQLPLYGPTPVDRPKIELEGFDWLNKAAAASSHAKTEAEKHAEAVQKVVQALDDEQAKLGLSVTEQRVMDELRKAGATAASEEGRAIADKVRALAMEEAQIKALAEQAEFAKSTTASFLTSFRQGVLSGEGALKSLEGAFVSFADTIMTKIEEMAADKLVTGLLGNLFQTPGLAGVLGYKAPVPDTSFFPPAPSAGALASEQDVVQKNAAPPVVDAERQRVDALTRAEPQRVPQEAPPWQEPLRIVERERNAQKVAPQPQPADLSGLDLSALQPNIVLPDIGTPLHQEPLRIVERESNAQKVVPQPQPADLSGLDLSALQPNIVLPDIGTPLHQEPLRIVERERSFQTVIERQAHPEQPRFSPEAPAVPAPLGDLQALRPLPIERPEQRAVEKTAIDVNLKLNSKLLEATIDQRTGKTVPLMVKRGWDDLKRKELPDVIDNHYRHPRRR